MSIPHEDAPTLKITKELEESFAHFTRKIGWHKHYQNLMSLARPTLALVETNKNPNEIHLGLSRIGGGPDLPIGVEWPRDCLGFNLHFIAQIDLFSLPVSCPYLPSTGLLSFFLGLNQKESLVLYTPFGQPLVHHKLPRDVKENAQQLQNMLRWNHGLGYYLIAQNKQDISCKREEDGRYRFYKKEQPIIALPEEMFIREKTRLLEGKVALTLPPFYHLLYPSSAFINPEEFWHIGEKGQYSMFGYDRLGWLEGKEGLAGCAVRYAKQRGWKELTDPCGWKNLFIATSTLEDGFCFSDSGDCSFMIHEHDLKAHNFSRIYAAIQSS